MIPTIGHTGIGPSTGEIHDFAGPYYISVNDFAFGETLKYVKLDIKPEDTLRWNQAIEKADRTY